MPVAVVVKVVALATAAVTGAAGLAWSATASGPENPAAVWVDGPVSGINVLPGLVAVTAHASAAKPVSALELLVDGKKVAEDTSLDRVGLLSLGTFGWEAAEGTHALVVKAGSVQSEVVTLVVSSRGKAPVVVPKPSASTSASATASATATPSASPTSSPSSSPTSSPEPGRTTPPPTVTPTRSPTPKPTPKPSPPAYAAGSISFANAIYWKTNSGGSQCPQYQPTPATVTVTNATSVSIEVGGVAFTASRNGTTWTATIDSGQVSGIHNQTNQPVRVLAQGPGGKVTSSAGTVIFYSCTKD